MDNIDKILQKVENDYNEFKRSMLEKTNSEIFDCVCKIFYIGEIRMILTSQGEYTDEEVGALLTFNGNILEQIYEEWISSSYIGIDGLDEVIDNTIRGLYNSSVSNSICRTKSDKNTF